MSFLLLNDAAKVDWQNAVTRSLKLRNAV